VDNKADVDAVFVDGIGCIVPVVNIGMNQDELEPAELAKLHACKHIILEGGADPTVHAYEELSKTVVPVFWEALAENSFVNLVRIPL
jgi:hypothetical protein